VKVRNQVDQGRILVDPECRRARLRWRI